MTWNEYTAILGAAEHRRVVNALGAALREVWQASEVVTTNGEAADLARHARTAARLLVEEVLGRTTSEPSPET
jgi:hypothetical protein